jgi:signal transduction histidine kinase
VNNPVNFALNAARAMESSLKELDVIAAHQLGGADGGNDDAKEVAEALRELAEIIEEGLNRTSVLIGNLRDFASPGTGGKARSTVSMERGLRSTLQLLARSLGDAGIEIEEDIEPGVPFVEGDAGALNQIMLNLLKNAIQALDGKGHIKVGLHGDEDWVRLTVADDGPGIDEANLVRLFDPFFTTKDPGEGTGLGLSISRQIAIEHGGDLRVQSTPGEGACFTLELPAI